MISQALHYRSLGFSVIPVNGKVPAVKWQEYQEVAADEEQLKEWWTKGYPSSNIGIVTGSVSRLVVLDLDGPNCAALLKEHGVILPRTATVQTGKGFHLYFRSSDGSIKNQVALLSDGRGSQVDIRGEGGFVVAPPSVHANGRTYLWTVPPNEIQPLPPDLYEFLDRQGGISLSAPWHEVAANGVAEGSRNATLAQVVGYWLRVTEGNVEAATRAAMLWNKLNNPPLPDDEVDRTISSIAERDAASRSKDLPRHRVYSGAELADELENFVPRVGIGVPVPGVQETGGLVSGDLVVLAGRPGLGKSTLGCQLTAEAMKKDIPTFVVSTEMSRQMWGRWTGAAWKGCTEKSMTPFPHDVLAAFRKAPLGMCDSGTVTIDEIRSLAEGRFGLKLLIVDHLTRVVGKGENRTQEVGTVARGLKSIAKDLDCTVVALCQMGRDFEKTERPPRLSDLRESGEIEQEADIVLFLYERRDELILEVGKYRYGPCQKINVRMDEEGRRFEYRM
jgi:hypothetical protein